MKDGNKKALLVIVMASLLVCPLSGCRQNKDASNSSDMKPPASVTEAPAEANAASSPVAKEAGMIAVEYKDADLDDDWTEEGCTKIACDGNSVTISGSGALAEGGVVTITKAGTYLISGTLTDGQIRVDATKNDKVRLVLNDADLSCGNNCVIYGLQSDKIIVTLADGTSNRITDGSAYVLEDEASGEPNAAIFSKDDVTINGSGSLTVRANYNHGVFTKNDLKIISGSIHVQAVNDGLKGRDSVVVKEAAIEINAKGDGIQSNNDAEPEHGYVVLEGGKYKIEAGLDGIQAETTLQVTGGDYAITTGGGSANASVNSNGEQNPNWGNWGVRTQNMPDVSAETDNDSAKAFKAGSAVIVTGGYFQVDSSDDAVHSNGTALLSGGEFDISSGDDGVHADSSLTVSGGTIRLNKSYEGLEGLSVTISDGNIHVKANDDGLNAAGGNDGSSQGGRPGKNDFVADGNAWIRISGGYVYIDSGGDGIDSNGNLYVEGGVTLVNGPTNDGNGALDYAGDAKITGGVFVAAGSSGMAETFSDTSTQHSVMVNYTTTQEAGTLVNLLDDSGTSVFGFAPSKQYQSILISTPDLQSGQTYTLTGGGEEASQDRDGYYEDSGNDSGTVQTEFTLSDVVTKIMNDGSEFTGKGNGMGRGGARPGGQMPNGQRPNWPDGPNAQDTDGL